MLFLLLSMFVAERKTIFVYNFAASIKKENANHNVPTFLDLNIIIKEGQFSSKLFDKKYGFNFSIVRLQKQSSRGVLRNFTKIHRKTPVAESLFFSLRPATLLKRGFWNRCFPVNFAEFLGTPFLQNISSRCFCGYYINIVVSLLKCFTPPFPQKFWEFVEQPLPAMIFFQVFIN